MLRAIICRMPKTATDAAMIENSSADRAAPRGVRGVEHEGEPDEQQHRDGRGHAQREAP